MVGRTLEEIREAVNVGYTRHTGIDITAVGEGFAEGNIVITDIHTNPFGMVHGGVSFCLGDVLGGAAFRTLGGLPVTLSSNVTYMRPLRNTGTIYGRAEVIKHGKTTSVVETKIFDEHMIECVRIEAVYYNVEERI